jgi:phosphoenolpyruvate carboxylase
MPPRSRKKPEIIEAADLAPAGQGAFSEQMWAGLSLLKDSGLSPATALNLLKTLIVESAYADKTEIEKLKLMDKLLNTARALMETSIKHEETAAIMARIEQLEARLQSCGVDRARRLPRSRDLAAPPIS